MSLTNVAPDSSTVSLVSNNSNLDAIHQRADVFQNIANKVKDEKLDASQVPSQLQSGGVTAEEAADYVEQVQEHFQRIREAPQDQVPSSSDGNNRQPSGDDNQTANDAANVVLWVQLWQKATGIAKDQASRFLGPSISIHQQSWECYRHY